MTTTTDPATRLERPAVPVEDVTRWHAAIADELREAFEACLPGTRFTLGPQLRAFEAEFAAYCGAGTGIGISSGTAALTLALRALGVGPGDEVITVPNTYVATVFAITYVGATPVFVDVDPVTANLDPARLPAALTPRTKAILPVHLYGQCVDIDAIRAAAPGIPILEDAAHAHGATLGERRAGGLGELAAFSFYPSKVMGALGDGGMITTSDAALDARLRQLRYMGQTTTKHEHVDLGYQERLDELQAAFLRVKLRHLEDQVAGRRRVAGRYRTLLADTPLELPAHDVDGPPRLLHVHGPGAPPRGAAGPPRRAGIGDPDDLPQAGAGPGRLRDGIPGAPPTTWPSPGRSCRACSACPCSRSSTDARDRAGRAAIRDFYRGA